MALCNRLAAGPAMAAPTWHRSLDALFTEAPGLVVRTGHYAAK